MGKFTEEGALVITGRIKEQYVCSCWKWVCKKCFVHLFRKIQAAKREICCPFAVGGRNRTIALHRTMSGAWRESSRKRCNHCSKLAKRKCFKFFFLFFFILFQVIDRLALPASASREELSSDRSVHKLLLDEVSRECVGQKHYAIPHKIIVSPTNFTVENGMATQKMSLKRKNIVHTFQNRINEIKFWVSRNFGSHFFYGFCRW